MDKHITINMSPLMFAVLHGLVGLGVAVMQNNKEAAQGLADMLGGMEPVAKDVVEMLLEIGMKAAEQDALPNLGILS